MSRKGCCERNLRTVVRDDAEMRWSGNFAGGWRWYRMITNAAEASQPEGFMMVTRTIRVMETAADKRTMSQPGCTRLAMAAWPEDCSHDSAVCHSGRRDCARNRLICSMSCPCEGRIRMVVFPPIKPRWYPHPFWSGGDNCPGLGWCRGLCSQKIPQAGAKRIPFEDYPESKWLGKVEHA